MNPHLSPHSFSSGCATFLLGAATALAQPGSFDATFAPAAMDSYIITITLQPNQHILAGGYFAQVNGSPVGGIVRLTPDGSHDTTFDPGTGPEAGGGVHAIAVQPDGKLLVGGTFTAFNGLPRAGIVRLHTNGAVDATYAASPNSNAAVLAITLLPDGRVLVGGGFRTMGGTPHRGLARLNADGTVDETFQTQIDPDVHSAVDQIVLTPDGRIYIAGVLFTVNGVRRLYLARLHADGSLDESFHEPTEAYAGKLALQPDGRLFVVGGFQNPSINMVRLNPDGTEDGSFHSPICDPPADPSVNAIALQPDEKILFGGNSLICAPFPRSVNRVYAQGAGDPSFEPWPLIASNYLSIVELKLQADGRIVVAHNRGNQAGVFRLNNDPPAAGIEFPTTLFTVSETSRVAPVTVRRSGSTRRAALVRLEIKPGTATPGRDYIAYSQWVFFPRGQSLRTVPILIRPDTLAEADETVRLHLRHPIGGDLGPRTDATLLIRDDDSPPHTSAP